MMPFSSEWGNFTPQTDGFSELALVCHIQNLDQQFLKRQTQELNADHNCYLPETRC